MGLAWAAGVALGTFASSTYFLSRKPRSPDSISESEENKATAQILEQIDRQFTITPSKLQEIFHYFIKEMERGLTPEGSSMKMIPAFLKSIASGSEMGSFLALDLGGTNFRVVRVLLEGQGRIRTNQKKFVVSDELKTGDGEKLFDFFADCVSEFMKEFSMDVKETYSLGFTFSFPVKQLSISSGLLMEWTKGFSASGVVGKDIVKIIEASFQKKGLKIKVTALVNDTVGTMIAETYKDANCVAGVILGTGTNAAYIEKVSSITKWEGEDKTGDMVINMEWGGFDDHKKVLPVTSYDLELDNSSINRGAQIYEKMISGMYLGEITRLAVADLVRKKLLFGGKISTKFETRYKFETEYMSRIERDHSSDLNDTKSVLEDIMEIPFTSLQDRRIVKRICEVVAIRAARLSAIGIAGITSKIGRLHGCTIAIDGSVFERYPHFSNRMRDAFVELFGMQADNIRMVLTGDGSGVGAGLIAAIASKTQ